MVTNTNKSKKLYDISGDCELKCLVSSYIGSRIIFFREVKGYSRGYVEAVAGMSPNSLRLAELGLMRPDGELLMKIATVLYVNVSDLLPCMQDLLILSARA